MFDTIVAIIVFGASGALILWGLFGERYDWSPRKLLGKIKGEEPQPTITRQVPRQGQSPHRPQQPSIKTQRTYRPQGSACASQIAARTQQGAHMAQSSARPQQTKAIKSKYNLPSAY